MTARRKSQTLHQSLMVATKMMSWAGAGPHLPLHPRVRGQRVRCDLYPTLWMRYQAQIPRGTGFLPTTDDALTRVTMASGRVNCK